MGSLEEKDLISDLGLSSFEAKKVLNGVKATNLVLNGEKATSENASKIEELEKHVEYYKHKAASSQKRIDELESEISQIEGIPSASVESIPDEETVPKSDPYQPSPESYVPVNETYVPPPSQSSYPSQPR